MRTHREQIQAEPDRPVTLTDRDVAALIALLAILEGEVLSGEASSDLTRQLSTRLAQGGLLPADHDAEALRRALFDLN